MYIRLFLYWSMLIGENAHRWVTNSTLAKIIVIYWLPINTVLHYAYAKASSLCDYCAEVNVHVSKVRVHEIDPH